MSGLVVGGAGVLVSLPVRVTGWSSLVTDGDAPDAGSIGPGLIGFLATFGVVVAAILLFRSMTGHLRKVDYRARHQPQGRQDDRASESSLEDHGDDSPAGDETGGDEPGGDEPGRRG